MPNYLLKFGIILSFKRILTSLLGICIWSLLWATPVVYAQGGRGAGPITDFGAASQMRDKKRSGAKAKHEKDEFDLSEDEDLFAEDDFGFEDEEGMEGEDEEGFGIEDDFGVPGEEQQEGLPFGGSFSKEKILEAYRSFMKMVRPKRRKGEDDTASARENPIWKFHSWLQEQLEMREQTGESGEGEGIEELCFVCHNGRLVANYNFSEDPTLPGIQPQLQLRSRHPVRDEDKSQFYDPLFPNDPTKSDPAWARKLQCTTCHNPAVVTGKTRDGGYPLTLPTDDTMPWMQKLIDGWPTLDTPPWPHDTPPRPLVYGQPFRDDPNPDVLGDEILGLDANDMPDFTTFCQTCHRQVSGRYGTSNNYSRLRYDPIRYIKGDGGGTISTHGLARGRESSTDILRLREPFYSLRNDPQGNAVNNLYLACTDCHEPHGSYNVFLLRTKVNGKVGVKVDADGKFYTLCSKCHYIENPWPGGYPHGGPGDMNERTCIECHHHSAGGGRF